MQRLAIFEIDGVEYFPIGGGSEEGEGDKGEGGGESLTAEQIEAKKKEEEEAKEPKDENGVPYKNRIAEDKRKREKLEKELIETRAKTDQLERMFNDSQTRQRQETPKNESELLSEIVSDPQGFTNKILQQGREIARKEAQVQVSQRKIYDKVAEEFPEISDKENEFTQEVDREYQQYKKYAGWPDGTEDAVTLQMIAERVDRKRLKAKMKESVGENPPKGEVGKQGRKPDGKKEITKEQLAIAKAIGLTESGAMKAYSRVVEENVNG